MKFYGFQILDSQLNVLYSHDGSQAFVFDSEITLPKGDYYFVFNTFISSINLDLIQYFQLIQVDQFDDCNFYFNTAKTIELEKDYQLKLSKTPGKFYYQFELKENALLELLFEKPEIKKKFDYQIFDEEYDIVFKESFFDSRFEQLELIGNLDPGKYFLTLRYYDTEVYKKSEVTTFRLDINNTLDPNEPNNYFYQATELIKDIAIFGDIFAFCSNISAGDYFVIEVKKRR